MKEKTLDINELFYLIKKRFKVILITTLTITLVAVIMAIFTMKSSYEAKVKIFAGKNEQIQSNYSQDELKSYSSLINTYIQLIKTEDFMNKVIDKAGLNLTSGELIGALIFSTSGDTPILEIKYSSTDPIVAEKVISTLTSEFEIGVKEVILNTYTKVIDSVKVVEIAPAKVKIIIVGLLAGVILGVVLIFIFNYLDDTLTKREELEKLLSIPVLAELPLEPDEISRSEKNKRNIKKNR